MQSIRLAWLAGILLLINHFTALAASPAGLPDFTAIVDEDSKAVVNVVATGTQTRSNQQALQGIPPQLQPFFNIQPQQQQEVQSSGTGFIISSDGYVLTNNHVVNGFSKVVVRLIDRRELDAEVVGTDPATDVALLKIKATDLPVMRIGDSDKLKVGEWVLAIGAPFGFDYSATAGIVSAKARTMSDESSVAFIQTDVAINPGNSGGPLINMNGEVVGINSRLVNPTGQAVYAGLSFAIPIEVAMDAADQIRANGKVTRGVLGVRIQDVTRDLADAYDLPKPAGAIVTKVMPDSAAQRAGIQEGDVITAFDGHDIGLFTELPQRVGRAKIGKKYPLTVIRDHKKVDLTVELAALPDASGDNADNDGDDSGKPSLNRLGMQVRDLTDQEKADTKLSNGVVVTQVGDGPAAVAGLHANDVILKLNGKPATSVVDFTAQIKNLPVGKAVLTQVYRHGDTLITAIRVPAADSKDKGKDKK